MNEIVSPKTVSLLGDLVSVVVEPAAFTVWYSRDEVLRLKFGVPL
jgi:hypothetical protein